MTHVSFSKLLVRFFRNLTVLFLWLPLSAYSNDIQSGFWLAEGEYSADHLATAKFSELKHQAKLLPLTGGEFWHVFDVSTPKPVNYVIDFLNSTVIGHFTHWIYDKNNGQLLQSNEGGLLSDRLNPYFLRHGRNITLPPGNYRIITRMSSPFLLAQPKPKLFAVDDYIRSIKLGNAITLIGLGVFFALGTYYIVLGVTRRQPTDYLYAIFILSNLLYNATALNVLSDVFHLHFFYTIGFPIMVSNIAYIGFVMRLLSINKARTPILYRAGISAMSILGCFWLVAPVIPNYSLEFARIGVAIFALYGITCGIVTMIQGQRISRYYLIANVAFVIPGIVSIGSSSISTETLMIEHLGLIAVALEVILLSLVLNMQLSTVYKEKSVSLYATEEALKVADEAIRTKERFLANISHELRTPLNAIQGSVDLLPAERLSRSDREHLNVIRHSSNFLLFLINDILDLAKLNADKLLLDKQTINIHRLTHKVGSIYKSMESKKAATNFKVDIADNVPEWIIGDEKRIEQVIANLLSNAFKFTKEGYVQLSTIVEHSRLRISVKDTGIGIQPEHLDSMFSEFTQADSSISRQYGGTGLGLRISTKLVELMEGKLKVNSEFGVGSEFYFSIPLIEADEIPANIVVESTEAVEIKSFSAARVAVIDDNSVNLKVMGGLLNKFNITNYNFDNADDALLFLSANIVDLVVMDMQMPITDGLTATRILRERNFAKPIIGFTANSNEEDQRACLDAGMDDLLIKPINQKALAVILNRWLADLAD